MLIESAFNNALNVAKTMRFHKSKNRFEIPFSERFYVTKQLLSCVSLTSCQCYYMHSVTLCERRVKAV